MTRAEAAAFVADRYGAYLSAASRSATDTPGGLGPAIDDALRALGLPVDAPPVDPDGEDDLRVQVTYRAMAQLVRDLGATLFNLSTQGDSLGLGSIPQNAQKELDEAKAAVLERFATLGVVSTGDGGALITMDLNFLDDPLVPAWGASWQ